MISFLIDTTGKRMINLDCKGVGILDCYQGRRALEGAAKLRNRLNIFVGTIEIKDCITSCLCGHSDDFVRVFRFRLGQLIHVSFFLHCHLRC